ncbi:TPA: hypothetical protein ACHKJJ_005090 [Escherichia coli]
MIYSFKTDFMRQIAMLFSLGYTRWFGGEIPLNPHYKFVSLKARFDELMLSMQQHNNVSGEEKKE